MARLKRILEPGERVLAQDPEPFVMWVMRACAAGMIVWGSWFVLDGNVIWGLLWLAACAIMILPHSLKPAEGLYLWQAALTDRRLIYRADNEAGHVAAPLTEIEVIRQRDPEEILADPSEEVRKAVKILGKSRIRDRGNRGIGIRHGDQCFYFVTGERKTSRLREIIAAAKGAA